MNEIFLFKPEERTNYNYEINYTLLREYARDFKIN